MEGRAISPLPSKDKAIPARDWIVLPLIALFTILVISICAEAAARVWFRPSETALSSCLIADAATGVRGIPNSECHEKISEGPLVEYRFDCAGYRTEDACKPKPPGTSRIVLIGSSVAMGQNVAAQDTFAALLPKELSRKSGHPFELYNYAMAFGFPRSTSLRFGDVLAANPDLVLWVVTSVDVKLASFSYADFARGQNAQSEGKGGVKDKIKDVMRALGLDTKLASLAALRHFIQKYKGQSQFIQSYLDIPDGNEGDWDAGPGALKAKLSEQWQARLKVFAGYAADILGKAKNAGIPVVAIVVPNRAQAAMISRRAWPDGYDPFRLAAEIRAIVERNGGTFVDILPDFRDTSNPERFYYPIDGHPDKRGHDLIAKFVAKELYDDSNTALKSAFQSAVVSGQVR